VNEPEDPLSSAMHGIWHSLTGEVPGPGEPYEAIAGRRVHAWARIDGPRPVRVDVGIDFDSAVRLARSMLSESPDDAAVIDAVAELCNQLAGGVKAVLPGERQLRLPEAEIVTLGADAFPGGSVLFNAISWSVGVGRVCLAVWELPEATIFGTVPAGG